jgi:molecular chaperone GrpE
MTTEENTQNNHANGEANGAVDENAAAATNADPTAELQVKLKEAEQKYVYLYAEFENFKKRSLKERQDIVKFGWENVASELLGVLDNLDRALQFAKPDTDPNLMSGLKMVSQQFATALEKQGVQAIATENQAFNPELHEGVGQLPSEKPAGTIVQEVQKGYTLHGRLLRASRVLVSTGVAAN